MRDRGRHGFRSQDREEVPGQSGTATTVQTATEATESIGSVQAIHRRPLDRWCVERRCFAKRVAPTRLCRRLQHGEGVSAAEARRVPAAAVRRFETPPGRQAQVDWGHLGTLEMEGEENKLSGFTFTLGYSRMMMAEAALDQKLGTLLRMHEEAFRQMDGVPEEILYDRMKTVWTDIDDRGEIIWHPVFLDFARYWDFTPRLCSAYRAQTKAQASHCTPLADARIVFFATRYERFLLCLPGRSSAGGSYRH